MPTSNEVVKSALLSLKGTWMTAIQNAIRYKWEVFGKQAKEAQSFYDGTYSNKDVVGSDSKFGAPSVAIQFNKVSEVVQLFGPTLYPDNPTRVITPVSPPDIKQQDLVQAAMSGPMLAQMTQQMAQVTMQQNPGADPNMVQQYARQQAQQMIAQQAGQQYQQYMDEANSTGSRNQIIATLISSYLNWTPIKLDLRRHTRLIINDAVVNGLGVGWTDVIQDPMTGQKIVGTFYDSVDNYLHDPDTMVSDTRSCKWQARRCISPTWEVERDFGLAPGSIKSNIESVSSWMMKEAEWCYRRSQDKTNDMFVYWKVWSKMGIGDRLPGIDDRLKQTMGRYGDYVYLVIADDIDYPLNLPPEFTDTAADSDIMKRLQWPVPFYGDNDWPCTKLQFHHNFKASYPMSHIRFAIGELQFMNWVVSMIAMKLHASSRDIIAVAAEIGDEFEQAIKSGGDLTVFKFKQSGGKKPEDLLHYLQQPPMNPDTMRFIPMVTEMLEKRLGINPLLYGESEGMSRSATDAEIRNKNSQIRIQEMQKDVQFWGGQIARKETIAVRAILGPQDVLPILQNAGTALWGQFVASSDPMVIFSQLEIHAEESDVRHPNRERLAMNMSDAMKLILPALQQQAAISGNYGPVNALLQDYGRSIDLDTKPYTLQSVQPSPVPGQPPVPGPPAPDVASRTTGIGSNT